MDMTTLAAPLLIGVCVAITLWQTLQVFTRVPGEQREYRDVPPGGFRLVWFPIRLVVFYAGAYMSEGKLELLQLKLGRAGVQYALDAREVFAAKFISAMVFVAVASMLVLIYGSSMLLLVVLAGYLGYHYPDSWLKQKAQSRQSEISGHCRSIWMWSPCLSSRAAILPVALRRRYKRPRTRHCDAN